METTEVGGAGPGPTIEEAEARLEEHGLERLVEVLEEVAQAGRELVEAVRSLTEASRHLAEAFRSARSRDPDRRPTGAWDGRDWAGGEEPTGW